MTNKQPEAGPMDIDSTTLAYEEWFFVWAVTGTRPDADMKGMTEWRQRSLGMSESEKKLTLRLGLESLIQRGAIKQVGTSAEGQPEYQTNFRIISRIREVQSAVPPPTKQ